MEKDPAIAKQIADKVAERLTRSKVPIPVGVSNRHVHLSQEHWGALFGAGTQPRKFRQVVQPGFYACFETVDIEGPKGRIDKCRLIAPHRPKTQVEVARTDALVLGIKAPVAGSGKLDGSAPIRIRGPKGVIEVQEGLIIPIRHVHFSPEEGGALGIRTGDIVRVRAGIGGPRELVFEQALCRVGLEFRLEFHIDTDEANAAWIKTGDIVHIC